MAVTLEYQLWASGDYNWLDKTTSTAAPQQINNKLTAWITAVNANVANTNKQITIRKGPADSTSANIIGWAIELASSTSGAGPMFARFYSNSTTNLVAAFSTAWLNDGTNGGYGASSGTSISDTTVSWYTSGQTAEFVCATETANGEEFFLLGWRLASNTTYSDAILLFKDSNGEWAGLFSDGGSIIGNYYMPTHPTPQRNFNVILIGNGATTNNTGYLETLVVGASMTTTQLPVATNSYTAQVRAASNALVAALLSQNQGFGRWASLAGSKTAANVHQGPFWVIY